MNIFVVPQHVKSFPFLTIFRNFRLLVIEVMQVWKFKILLFLCLRFRIHESDQRAQNKFNSNEVLSENTIIGLTHIYFKNTSLAQSSFYYFCKKAITNNTYWFEWGVFITRILVVHSDMYILLCIHIFDYNKKSVTFDKIYRLVNFHIFILKCGNKMELLDVSKKRTSVPKDRIFEPVIQKSCTDCTTWHDTADTLE